MMKKTFGSLMVLTLLAIGAPAFAEDQVRTDGSVSTEAKPLPNPPLRGDIRVNRDALKKEIKDDRGTVRANIEVKRDQIKDMRASSTDMRKDMRASSTAARKENRREAIEKNIKKHAEQMTERFNAAVERFEKITVRLDSRIAKVKTEGRSTADAEKFEAEAKVSIEKAKTDIATIPAVLANALSQEKLEGSFKELEALASNIRKNLVSGHSFLIKAAVSLKTDTSDKKTEGTSSTNVEVR